MVAAASFSTPAVTVTTVNAKSLGTNVVTVVKAGCPALLTVKVQTPCLALVVSLHATSWKTPLPETVSAAVEGPPMAVTVRTSSVVQERISVQMAVDNFR